MDVADFDFELPDRLIAQDPPARRGESRLLVLSRETGSVRHSRFALLGEYLRSGDLLVVNDTRVFPARLLGERVPSGGAVECLLLHRLDAERWDALMHPGQKLKPGARVVFPGDGVDLHGEILDQHFFGRRTIRLRTSDGSAVDAAIDAIGHIPLPPYIKREDRPSDRERYQTIYATRPGSIAAPTAGLHFTEEVFADLRSRGVERVALTLHVGYGTFKPVRAERVEDHVVDAEEYSIDEQAAEAISNALRERRRIIAVGTTTARALESVKVKGECTVEPSSGTTRLFIHPGHQFRTVTGLVTNFHLPRSSLLMLVAALAGREQTLAAYEEAVRKGYRFYSYGDAMLVL